MTTWYRNPLTGGSTTIYALVGHNPQLLIADQRGTLKRWADDYGEIDYSRARLTWDQFREIYPDTLKAFTDTSLGEPYDPTKHFPAGGSPTGRFRPSDKPRWFFPRDEAVLPKDHPIASVDFGGLEERVLAHRRIPVLPPGGMIRFLPRQPSFSKPVFYGKFDLSVEGAEKFAAAMRRASNAAREMSERLLLLTMYGGSPWTRPLTPDEKQGRRILDLLSSSDRRQRKRGNRLFRRWMRSRPGINWSA